MYISLYSTWLTELRCTLGRCTEADEPRQLSWGHVYLLSDDMPKASGYHVLAFRGLMQMSPNTTHGQDVKDHARSRLEWCSTNWKAQAGQLLHPLLQG